MVIGMQQMMGFLTQRCLQEFAVEGKNLRILVGESHRILTIQVIQILTTASCQFLSIVDRLSATARAAARTRHDHNRRGRP